MKKKCIISVVLLGLFMAMAGLASAETINGCSNKWSGKFRIVDDVCECTFWEREIIIESGECDCPITQAEVDYLHDNIEYLLENALIGRFTDMGDGTVRDNNTGLIWLKDADEMGEANWVDANAAAASLSDGEHGLSDGSSDTDWRLPTKEEWEAFVVTSYEGPALCNAAGTAQWTQGDVFIDIQSGDGYWSSTEYGTSLAWPVDMFSGIMYYYQKTGSNFIWPVRSDN